MFGHKLSVCPEARLAELEDYRGALITALKEDTVYAALGQERHASISDALSRVTLAELTPSGSVEIWSGAPPDAIAVLPVLRGEHPEQWNIGASIVETLSASALDIKAAKGLRPAYLPENAANPEDPNGRLWDKEFAYPLPPTTECSAVTQSGRHLMTDGSEKVVLHSRSVILLYPIKNRGEKAVSLGHELVHTLKRKDRVEPFIPRITRADVLMHCIEEAAARTTEGDIAAGIGGGKWANKTLKLSVSSIKHHLRYREQVLAWMETAERTGNTRYLTANMIHHGYFNPGTDYLDQLPPEDKDCLHLPID